jgi:type II secretory pathway pseudopilin PulG
MRRRHAFTIVELLVATALIIFVMAILAEAFSAGLTTFRQLKAIGDMQERLRTAAIVFRRDLTSFSIEDPAGNPWRLSSLQLNNPQPGKPGQQPPATGYFRIWQDSSGTTNEGNETVAGGTIASYRSTKHVLQFTCKLNGPERENWHSAPVPAGLPLQSGAIDAQGPLAYQQPGLLVSPWYEVTYFLQESSDSGGNADTAGTTTLFSLHRREQVISVTPNPTNVTMTGAPSPASPYDVRAVSMDPSYTFNAPAVVTQPYRRFGMQALQNPPVATDPNLAGVPTTLNNTPWLNPPWAIANEVSAGTNDARAGDDILLTDVLSFDIKVAQITANPAPSPPTGIVFTDLAAASSSLNTTFVNQSVSVFDTWSTQGQYASWNTPNTATSLPLAIRVLAVKITLRVWDARTQQARELSIIQNM